MLLLVWVRTLFFCLTCYFGVLLLVWVITLFFYLFDCIKIFSFSLFFSFVFLLRSSSSNKDFILKWAFSQEEEEEATEEEEEAMKEEKGNKVDDGHKLMQHQTRRRKVSMILKQRSVVVLEALGCAKSWWPFLHQPPSPQSSLG